MAPFGPLILKSKSLYKYISLYTAMFEYLLQSLSLSAINNNNMILTLSVFVFQPAINNIIEKLF